MTVPAWARRARPAWSRLSPWWSWVRSTAPTGPISAAGMAGPVSFCEEVPQPKMYRSTSLGDGASSSVARTDWRSSDKCADGSRKRCDRSGRRHGPAAYNLEISTLVEGVHS